ncbi:MAG: hypothetical protein R2940_06380 [Syntrophotaleaceae bacterium]
MSKKSGVMERKIGMVIFHSLLIFFVAAALSGCSGVAKGVTQAILESKQTSPADSRQCHVRGRPFAGLATFLDEDQEKEAPPDLKVLMVHGMGSHYPGYAARMAENLAQALSLDRVQEHHKELPLSSPFHPDKRIGNLRACRFFDSAGTRNMIFYELTWDSIVESEKETLRFDSSEEYAYRRATINRLLKEFVNGTIPDVLMYNGTSHELIHLAVAQSLCWMMTREWEDFPSADGSYCDPQKENILENIDDRIVFITHSLGSRITIDTMQRLATMVRSDPRLSGCAEALKQKEFTVFMLSNQLPLLQMGRPKPEVTGKIEEICSSSGPLSGERLFGELKIIAFSDPNDLFSYALPPRFLDEHLDSRLCPTLTNVVLNVAPVNNLFGLGELANPVSAHIDYDNDSRVIGLITRGIGGAETDPEVQKCCAWVEAVPEKGREK